MDSNISNYLQNQLKQAQQLELQIEQIETQRYQIDMRIKELEKTLQELEKISEGTMIYKSVGPVLYSVEDKKKLVDELAEQKELSEIRIKTLEKQHKSFEEKYKEIEELIKKTYEQGRKGNA
ncbi:MAG: prefoldin subunit beta [Thermoplasmataceae archaeon]